MLTKLEKKVIETLNKPNGNGEMLGDYLELWHFDIDNKVLRGVLSSLSKKRALEFYDWEFGTVVEKGEKWDYYVKEIM